MIPLQQSFNEIDVSSLSLRKKKRNSQSLPEGQVQQLISQGSQRQIQSKQDDDNSMVNYSQNSIPINQNYYQNNKTDLNNYSHLHDSNLHEFSYDYEEENMQNKNNITIGGIPLQNIYENSEWIKPFQCFICTNVAVQPIRCTNCSGLFCKGCLDQLEVQLENKKWCPKCQQQQSLSISQQEPELKPDYNTQRFLQDINVDCVYKKNGCTEIIQYANYEDHIKNCPKRSKICLNCGENFICDQAELHRNLCQLQSIQIDKSVSEYSNVMSFTRPSFVQQADMKTFSAIPSIQSHTEYDLNDSLQAEKKQVKFKEMGFQNIPVTQSQRVLSLAQDQTIFSLKNIGSKQYLKDDEKVVRKKSQESFESKETSIQLKDNSFQNKIEQDVLEIDGGSEHNNSQNNMSFVQKKQQMQVNNQIQTNRLNSMNVLPNQVVNVNQSNLLGFMNMILIAAILVTLYINKINTDYKSNNNTSDINNNILPSTKCDSPTFPIFQEGQIQQQEKLIPQVANNQQNVQIQKELTNILENIQQIENQLNNQTNRFNQFYESMNNITNTNKAQAKLDQESMITLIKKIINEEESQQNEYLHTEFLDLLQTLQDLKYFQNKQLYSQEKINLGQQSFLGYSSIINMYDSLMKNFEKLANSKDQSMKEYFELEKKNLQKYFQENFKNIQLESKGDIALIEKNFNQKVEKELAKMNEDSMNQMKKQITSLEQFINTKIDEQNNSFLLKISQLQNDNASQFEILNNALNLKIKNEISQIESIIKTQITILERTMTEQYTNFNKNIQTQTNNENTRPQQIVLNNNDSLNNIQINQIIESEKLLIEQQQKFINSIQAKFLHFNDYQNKVEQLITNQKQQETYLKDNLNKIQTSSESYSQKTQESIISFSDQLNDIKSLINKSISKVEQNLNDYTKGQENTNEKNQNDIKQQLIVSYQNNKQEFMNQLLSLSQEVQKQNQHINSNEQKLQQILNNISSNKKSSEENHLNLEQQFKSIRDYIDAQMKQIIQSVSQIISEKPVAIQQNGESNHLINQILEKINILQINQTQQKQQPNNNNIKEENNIKSANIDSRLDQIEQMLQQIIKQQKQNQINIQQQFNNFQQKDQNKQDNQILNEQLQSKLDNYLTNLGAIVKINNEQVSTQIENKLFISCSVEDKQINFQISTTKNIDFLSEDFREINSLNQIENIKTYPFLQIGGETTKNLQNIQINFEFNKITNQQLASLTCKINSKVKDDEYQTHNIK